MEDINEMNLKEIGWEDVNWVHLAQDKGKAIPLHAMEALGVRGGIAPTHSRTRH
jgi:hypothetical protein